MMGKETIYWDGLAHVQCMQPCNFINRIYQGKVVIYDYIVLCYTYIHVHV